MPNEQFDAVAREMTVAYLSRVTLGREICSLKIRALLAEPVAFTDEASSFRHGAQLRETAVLHLAFEAKNAFVVLA